MAEKVTSSRPPEGKESSPCLLQGMENKSNVMVVYTCHFLPTGRRLYDGRYSYIPRDVKVILRSDIIHIIYYSQLLSLCNVPPLTLSVFVCIYHVFSVQIMGCSHLLH